MALNEARVYFELYGGDFDPDVVTACLGVEPTATRRKGNPKPKCSAWLISSDTVADEFIDVSAMASELVSRLRKSAGDIVRLMSEHELEAVLEVVLTITMDDSKSTPAIGFDCDTVAFLATVGASIDVDTYRG